jgi:GNAT superfamily N-acetyltransferase
MAAVQTDTWRDAYAGLLPDDLIASITVERRTATWTRAIASHDMSCWVAEVDGTIVGICSLGPSEEHTSIGRIYTIYVVSPFWGRGVGSSLWDAALDEIAARFTGGELWVLESNTRARSFYERKGWRFDGGVRADTSFGQAISEVRYRSIDGDPTTT